MKFFLRKHSGNSKPAAPFVKTRNRYVILGVGKPAASVTEDAYSAIIDMLVQRTDRRLKNRF